MVEKNPDSVAVTTAVHPVDPRVLHRRAARGTALTLAGQLLKLVLNLSTTLILARFVTREDFGIFAVALSLQTVLIILRDNGLAGAIIQSRNVTALHINSVFWLGLGLGLVLAVAVGILAQPLARFYGRGELAGIIWCVALTVIVQVLSSVPDAQFRKAIQFRRIVIADLTAVTTASLAAVLGAMLGMGLWSLALRMVLGPVIYAILCWTLSTWRPRLQFSWEAVRTLWSFGVYLFLTTFIGFGLLQLDSPIIGRLIGVTAAGVYFVAANLTVRPLQEIVSTATQVMFPVFSAVQHDAAIIRSGMLTATRGLCTLLFPLGAGLIATAPELVPVLIGPEWVEAIPVMQVLALHVLPICLNYPASHILAARGRSKLQFGLAVLRGTAILAAMVVGCRGGIVWAAVAWTIARVIFESPVLWYGAREIQLRLTPVLSATAWPGLASVLSLIIVRVLAWSWNSGGWGPGWALLAAEMALGGTVYALLAALWFRETLTKLMRDLFTPSAPSGPNVAST